VTYNLGTDTTAPTVAITAPLDSATVSGNVTVAASASDNVGVSKVEFYVNNVLQATDTSSPYSFNWNTTSAANGSYTLSAKAYDAAGNVGQSSNISVTVSNTYTISASAGSGGTISPAGNSVVNYGGSQTFSITPDNGYKVADVTVDGSSVGAVTSYTFSNVTANHTISVNFAVNTYTLTYTAGVNGTVSGSTPQTVNSGGSGTLVTAVANTGYHFVSWSDGVTTAARTDSNVTANISVTANFAVNTYTLTYTAGVNGTVSGSTPQTVNSGGSGTLVTAVANTGYHFVSWSDGVTTAARTDANVTANISVTATFAVNTYALTYTAGVNGTVSGSTPQTVNSGASGTPVTAVANTGYHFVSWSDGVTTAARTDSNVTANISVTANFAVNTYTLTYTAGVNGTVSGSTSQTVNSGASGTPVTAVANSGYHFVSWSDGVTTAARTDANVTANISVTANFAVNTYTLTYTAGLNGTISGSTPQTVNSGASGTPVTAVANTGYHFVSWSDGVTTAARTDSNVTAKISVTATFAINNTSQLKVSISSPVANATVKGTVTVKAAATDSVKISKVQFYLNGVLKCTDTSSPYSYSWITTSSADGIYTLTAKAYDAAGNISSSTIAVSVKNDTTAPKVSISSPATNANVSGIQTVTATASDNVGVKKVAFYVNGELQVTDTASPWSFSWNTASLTNGAYTLSAKAYDASGNVGQSSTVSVTVFN
jgi:ribosome-associated toxin RatA of RatAB toxin-antitoxin module